MGKLRQSPISNFMFPMSFLMFSLNSLSILITNALNSAFVRLLVSFSFSSFSGDLSFYLGQVSLSPHFGCLPVCIFYPLSGTAWTGICFSGALVPNPSFGYVVCEGRWLVL